MGRSTSCAPLGCFLSILASVAAAAFLAFAICAIGYGNSVSDSCDTQTEAKVESAFFGPHLQLTGGIMADNEGVCILDVTFKFEGTRYNRTLYAVCNSCGDFYRQHDERSQTLPICFKGSPESRGVLLAHGQFGADFTNKRTTLRWRVALAVSGGITAGSIVLMLISCLLGSFFGACKRKIGTTSAVVPQGMIAREQELFQKL